MSNQSRITASFFVSGIMCHEYCGIPIKQALDDCLLEYKAAGHLPRLPEDTELLLATEPSPFEMHQYVITLESSQPFHQADEIRDAILSNMKARLTHLGFDVVDQQGRLSTSGKQGVNWINIFLNLASMGLILLSSVLFPASLLLTIALFSISFLSTAFTARAYLVDFFHHLGTKNLAHMSTMVTLGWFLSLMHTLYHSIAMPLCDNFSMIFMSFIMPVLLITVINGMDEVKRLVLNKSKEMQLQGMKTLFPEMAETYQCYALSSEALLMLSQEMPTWLESVGEEGLGESFYALQKQLVSEQLVMKQKNSLKKGMLFKVLRGERFPVDCRLIQGNTVIDAALVSGEPKLGRRCFDTIPAGALNLGQPVTVLAMDDTYNSTVNKILFRANRARIPKASDPTHQFNVFYFGLMGVGMAVAIIMPYFLGILTLPLLLQNLTGILFAVCPCTMTIAHQLPNLLSSYQRSKKGIILRDESLLWSTHPIHTVVFDKTGTLTTGQSQVAGCEGISPALWERIYLLEKDQGEAHPLANAMIDYYEKNISHQSPNQVIQQVVVDSNNRGLSAVVQGLRLDIGNAEYLAERGVRVIPSNLFERNPGFTPVYVAERGVYQGVILVQHEIRKDMAASLLRLKKQGIKIIMLTGDTRSSALCFNQQQGYLFDEVDIHAAQTPDKKEDFLKELMKSGDKGPNGVWFIGDGLNDAQSARVVSEKGGVSCAMTADDKAAFFTDIRLNASLDYLFEHNQFNQRFKKNVLQNQWLLTYGAMTFLAYIIVFSVAGIVVPPLIPLIVMSGTTLFVLLNAYRVQHSMDKALDKSQSRLKRFLLSDLSIGSLLGASLLFNVGLLLSTLTLGGLVVPSIVFTAGAGAAICSACLMASCGVLGTFLVAVIAYLLIDNSRGEAGNADIDELDPVFQNSKATIPLPNRAFHHHLPLNLEKVDLSLLHSQAIEQSFSQEIENGGRGFIVNG